MNTYKDCGLTEIINASGRMTKLGVSTISDEVANALVNAGQNYVLIDELYRWSGIQIANLIGCNDVCVTSSASAAISLSISSLICGNNLYKVQHFYDVCKNTKKREVIILKGHNVDFGAPIDLMIQSGGGIVKEQGYANGSTVNDIEDAINENTLAILFVKSHHCVQKNMVELSEVIEVAKRNNIPCIVDAAAEEDLSVYNKMGADVVCYSGAKAISGPTSGFAACNNTQFADAMRLQFKGIGRIMKIGKENCFGLVKAIEIYQKNHGYKSIITKEELCEFSKKINTIIGLKATIIQDEAGREIFRCKINIDEISYGINGLELVNCLKNNKPSIYTRDYQANLNSIAIDPRPLKSTNELDEIYNALINYKVTI
ncbi:MAG: DgaE family pyridoxal phosphate-dependent ammonia lyase [Erysipelotrichaceae bacterium]